MSCHRWTLGGSNVHTYESAFQRRQGIWKFHMQLKTSGFAKKCWTWTQCCLGKFQTWSWALFLETQTCQRSAVFWIFLVWLLTTNSQAQSITQPHGQVNKISWHCCQAEDRYNTVFVLELESLIKTVIDFPLLDTARNKLIIKWKQIHQMVWGVLLFLSVCMCLDELRCFISCTF